MQLFPIFLYVNSDFIARWGEVVTFYIKGSVHCDLVNDAILLLY